MVDHSGHHNHGGDMLTSPDPAAANEGEPKDMMDMLMTMYFYQSTKVHFLFDSYDVQSASGYFSVLLVSFIFGFMTETLSIVQDRFD